MLMIYIMIEKHPGEMSKVCLCLVVLLFSKTFHKKTLGSSSSCFPKIRLGYVSFNTE